ncbi:MAG: hypothetical protein AAGA96_08580 [Verrucomicrobiota bacterium]
MNSHAAVPRVLPISPDHYRVYFSTRDTHQRSSPAFFEFSPENPLETSDLSQSPILPQASLGAFDDSGVMPSCFVQVESEIWMYYVGWNLSVTVPFRNSLGLAISRDNGLTFERYSRGPVLGANYVDPYFTASAWVVRQQQQWVMLYLSCTEWTRESNQARHHYLLKSAKSSDGIHWERNGNVAIGFRYDNEYAISAPTILIDDGLFKMWYSYRGGPDFETYRIGYAESVDGENWTRKDEEVSLDVSTSGWDSEMICYPCVFSHNEQVFMLYNGNGYGETGIGLARLG